ncbi:CRE-URI-1 protein [Caenorhabditis remanei]|uniref:CRE-URI-1 protein n=2 Tax=Caenorhabditis remanei TaxID=31234 RepID=E3LY94_CAERE|nr:CRE-URI-1 protein [Caenorhabditis remanei]
MTDSDDDDLNSKMCELYVAECMAARARLEVETECRRLIADNYEKTLKQVKEYSLKLEVPITAKVCDVGYFCDAHVVRTNQVTMEMGSSHYVECAIHTADKIIARRVGEMRRSRDDGLESIRMLNDKIKFAQENFTKLEIEGDAIEIVEKYDDEMEKMFYENRRKKRIENEKAAKEKEVAEEKKVKTESEVVDEEHEKVMNRLAELELLEENNAEVEKEAEEVPPPKPFEVSVDALMKLEEVEEDEDDADEIRRINERLLAQPGVSQREMERLLRYLDASEHSSEEEAGDGDEEEEEDEEEVNEGVKVEELDSDDYASDIENVNVEADESSKTSAKAKPASKVVEVNEKTSTTTTVTRKKSGVRFAAKLENVKTFRKDDTVEVKTETTVETKSILRNTEPTPVDRSALEGEPKEIATMSSATFPGEIVEKNPYDCEPSTSKDPAPVITEKKVSKFRASRHRN